MSREHRDVIDLIYYRERSVEEVAEIMHTPKNTMKTQVHHARKRLAGLLLTPFGTASSLSVSAPNRHGISDLAFGGSVTVYD
jgi:hypothetical protein